MAPPACALGTIFFQEDVILVPRGLGEEDAFKKGGVPPLRLPLLGSAKIPRPPGAKTPGAKSPLTTRSYSSQAEELPFLPNIVQAASSPSPSVAAPPYPELLPSVPTKPRRRRKNPKRRHGRLLREAPMSNMTLTEVSRVSDTAGGAVVCRYDGLEQELRKVTATKALLAHHRREVARHESEFQRARIRKRGQRRKQKAQKQDEKHDDESDEEEEEENTVSELRTVPAAPERRPSMLCRPSVGSCIVSSTLAREALQDVDVVVEEQPPALRALQKIKFKVCKEVRMQRLTRDRDQHDARNRQLQISELRTRDFEELPQKEQEALKVAFTEYLDDSPDVGRRRSAVSIASRGLSLYTPSGKLPAHHAHNRLFPCLFLLGLNGKTSAEEKEISSLCNEFENDKEVDFNVFCFEVVPQVRAKLMEMRQEALSEQFAYYDQDSSGFLDYDECLDMFRNISRNLSTGARSDVEQEFLQIFDELKFQDEQCGEHVDFDGFQLLIERVREKCNCVQREHAENIIFTHGMTEEQAVCYADELLTLDETFTVQDGDGNGRLDATEVVHALFEVGLIPSDIDARGRVEELVEKAVAKSGVIGINFTSFLKLIKQVREQNRQIDTRTLHDYFNSCDRKGNGLLTFAEASAIFRKLGLMPQCREDQDEMKDLLLKVDADNSGDLDFEEFQELVQHITEKLRSNQRQRENDSAKKLGFVAHQVAELREVFFHLDSQGSGRIGVDECRKMLTLLRIEMSAKDLHTIFQDVDKSQLGRIELEDFFYFVWGISKRKCERCTGIAPQNKEVYGHPRTRESVGPHDHSADWDHDVLKKRVQRQLGTGKLTKRFTENMIHEVWAVDEEYHTRGSLPWISELM